MDTPPRVYLRAVKLVLRDAQSQRIVYETSAQYDEVRVNDDTIWQVLFDAALTGFPAPPAGPRQVTLLPAPAPAEAPAPQAPASVPLPGTKVTLAIGLSSFFIYKGIQGSVGKVAGRACPAPTGRVKING